MVRRVIPLEILLTHPRAVQKNFFSCRTLKCSATVLNKNWFLTSAHCLRPCDGSNHRVNLQCTYAFIGESNSTLRAGNTKIRRYFFKKYLIHKSYDPLNRAVGADIALLELKRPLDSERYSHVDRPISSSTNLGPNKTFFMAGYGRNKFIENKIVRLANTIQEAPMDVKWFGKCRRGTDDAYRPYLDENKLVCANPSPMPDGRIRTCFRTRGTPVFLRKAKDGSALQIGVLSFSLNDTCGGVSWFTRLSTYRAAILNGIANNYKEWNVAFY